jgi:cytochrome b subunit of formate dehydrogenase
MLYGVVVLVGSTMAASRQFLNRVTRRIFHRCRPLKWCMRLLASFYIGRIGMEDVFEAMVNGGGDANWAREHHSLWLEKAYCQRAGAGVTCVRGQTFSRRIGKHAG